MPARRRGRRSPRGTRPTAGRSAPRTARYARRRLGRWRRTAGTTRPRGAAWRPAGRGPPARSARRAPAAGAGPGRRRRGQICCSPRTSDDGLAGDRAEGLPGENLASEATARVSVPQQAAPGLAARRPGDGAPRDAHHHRLHAGHTPAQPGQDLVDLDASRPRPAPGRSPWGRPCRARRRREPGYAGLVHRVLQVVGEDGPAPHLDAVAQPAEHEELAVVDEPDIAGVECATVERRQRRGGWRAPPA